MEVAEAFVTLVPSAAGFGGKASRVLGGELDRAGRDGGKRYSTGLTTAIAGTASKVFAPLAAAAAGAGIVSFFSDAVTAASDFAETGSAVTQIFGAGAAQVKAFASTSATALGQTQTQALGAAKTFGTFGKAAGLTGSELASFSTDFVGLSADLASFNNTTPEQAIEAVGAALRGESEPIRQYGVLLDDATLRTEAMRLGLIKTTKQALTPQQKVLAAQAAIYRQTADAQGDFQRTSGGLANQQRILSAQWGKLKSTLGAALLPAITSVVTALNKALGPAIQRIGPTIDGIKGAFATASTMFRPFTDGLSGVFDLIVKGDFTSKLGAAFGISEDSPVIDGVLTFRDTVIAAFTTVRDFISGLFSGGGGGASSVLTYLGSLRDTIVPGLRGIFGAVSGFASTVFPIVAQVFGTMVALVRQYLPQIQGIVTQVFSTVRSIVEAVMVGVRVAITVVTTVVGALWKTFGGVILGTITRVFPALLTIIKGALNIIQGVVRLFTALLTGNWSGAWNAVKQIVSGAWGVIKGVVSAGIALIRGAIGIGLAAIKGQFALVWAAVKAVVSAAWTSIKSAVSTGIGAVVGLVRSLPGRMSSAIGDLGSIFYEKGRAAIQSLINGIRAMLGPVGDAIGAVAGKVGGFFHGSPVKEGPLKSWNNGGAGRRLVRSLVQGIDAETPHAQAALTRLTSSLSGPTASGAIALSGTGTGAQAPITFTGPITAVDVDEMAAKVRSRLADAMALIPVGVVA